MMFVFASMGNHADGWPVHAMHVTEAAFLLAAFGCLVLGNVLSKIVPYQLVAAVGGIGAGFGLVMPFELAPFFLGVKGEWMLASICLILAYPIVVPIFIAMYGSLLRR
jgi:thiosulfate dehydrogenase [quinone] large subunit